jgi:squalene-hopene/tetraprenyl-beta-curcumene cyclase
MAVENVVIQRPIAGDALKNQFEAVEVAARKTQRYLLENQSPEGYWVGELTADASVSAGYIPLMYFMTGKVDSAKQAKVINYVKSQQKDDGSWSAYYGGPGDLNVSVQVYFALKLAGVSAEEPCMQKAKNYIRSSGGIMKTNTVTRIWLAVFGQFDYRGTPSIPPEIVLLPNWFYINIYEFASWSRETIMALMLVLASKPVCQVPENASISELYLEPPEKRRYKPAERENLISWRSFFLYADKIYKIYEKLAWRPFHKMALKRVEKWVVGHQEADGSWGGIILPWIYSLMALKSFGYGPEHPVIVKGMKGLASFLVEDKQNLIMQPATSVVWDTAWGAISLVQSGIPAGHPALVKAAKWMLREEIRTDGDWKIKNRKTESGCWAFEFENDRYPDIDDTAVVARALLNIKLSAEEDFQKAESVKRGLSWVKAMQSSDGGWAAFDRDNNRNILSNVPYSDFITPLDPTSADVTAHALELAGKTEPGSLYIKHALEYLKRIQQTDGSWYGRWGVNYIYGTGLVLVSMKAVGEDMSQDYILNAAAWLESHQNPDGGWGETCKTYIHPSARGKGPSTASQSAWALMGLIAAGKVNNPAIEKGINYLLQNQNADGSWTEPEYTGTGFPRVFYLRYDLYRVYFPLLALAQYKVSQEEKMDSMVEQLSQINPADRILLLPHCLRQSNTCVAKYNGQGLQCSACNPDCAVNRLRTAALNYGYKGVCVAPGGRLAVNFVKEKHPEAIVAVACEKELEEGVQGVGELADQEIKPFIMIIPLLKDGCVNTVVDMDKALQVIGSGCLEKVGKISD